MQEDDEIVGEVNKSNAEFYHAFESLYKHTSRLGFIYWLVNGCFYFPSQIVFCTAIVVCISKVLNPLYNLVI